MILSWFLLGGLSALWEYLEMTKIEKRSIDDIDYIYMFGVIIFGYISFVVTVFDIYQNWRWFRD